MSYNNSVLRPDHLFAREHEWDRLEQFVDQPRAGAALGVVFGRRRQGKTYLLESLIEARGGLIFTALQQSEHQNLQRLGDLLAQHSGAPGRVATDNWDDGLAALLSLSARSTRPLPIVLDEFPYLAATSPHIPSLLQSALSPRSKASRQMPARLLLCGSALSTMHGLLGAGAPLRGRASLELLVHPFELPEAAAYWGVADDAELAVRLHGLIGGTPGYLDMCGRSRPATLDDLDTWIVETLLDPASAMFREGELLLSEEPGIADRAAYNSILSAISNGRTRRGEIAAALARQETALARQLTVLTEARLIERVDDAFRQKRAAFRIAEPMLRLHQLVIAPSADRLQRQRGHEVWEEAGATVASKVFGPHLEDLARWWCSARASSATLGGRPSRVAPTVLACREHRAGHEVDLVAIDSDAGRAVLAIGEVKWSATATDLAELHRLEHVRNLLPQAKGDEARAQRVKMVLVSRSGFTRGLRDAAAARHDIELVDLERLLHGD